MKEYKRLTNRTGDKTYLVYFEKSFISNGDKLLEYAIQRLAELEDKIENGTLIFKEKKDENSRKK